MLDRIFIVEEQEAEIEFLKQYLSMAIEESRISIIHKIDKAFQEIKSASTKEKHIAVFIDIFWGMSEARGIVLAKNIRKELPAIRLIAYTRVGSNDELFRQLSPHFDAIIDKIEVNPHPSSIKVDMVDRDFLLKLSDGYDFYKKDAAGKSTIEPFHYVFSQTHVKPVFAQLVVTDFANFSLRDDDHQLRRFNALQKALLGALSQDSYLESNLVVLPTGDGLIIGIIEDVLRPTALRLGFRLLENLRQDELDAELRIGVHYGRVFLLEGDKSELQLIGTGINKAARVQSESQPGKILVSEEYFSAFIDRSGDPFCRELTAEDWKECSVKNEPVFRAIFISKGKIGA